MEKVWGKSNSIDENNIQWERAYVTFNTLGGTFDVGYQTAGTFGTVFADEVSGGQPRIKYTYVNGPLKILALTEKNVEYDIGTTQADADYDKYSLGAIYKFDGGDAGLLVTYYNDARSSAVGDGDYKGRYYLINPYFKSTFGPVYVEGEFNWRTGKKVKQETSGTDTDYDGKSAYLMAKVDLGQFYVGAQVAYVQGDDQATTDDESGPTGQDYIPCLILFGDDAFYKFNGAIGSGTGNTTSETMSNAILYQGFAGFKPLAKLEVKASLTAATADEKNVSGCNHVSDEYGTEFDVTATYKIYDNLSYMVGFGYLWTGDYYKGSSNATKVDDNYLLMNKLLLTF